MRIRYATLQDIKAITKIYNDSIKYSNATYDIDPKTVSERIQWYE